MKNENWTGECYFCGGTVTEENLEIRDDDHCVCTKPECTNQVCNSTGYCSTYCKITGHCDESC
jgi:hypothetical protein